MCYICGREFGTRSIGIHIPNCEKKWETEQKKLPKSQRRPVPTRPDQFDRVISGEMKSSEIQNYNEKAFDDFNSKALEECSICHRTFLPRPLEIHRKSCKPKDLDALPKVTKPKVKVPKFRKKTSETPPAEEPSPKEIVVAEEEQEEEEEPKREDLVKMVKKDKVLDLVENRRDLMNFLEELRLRSE